MKTLRLILGDQLNPRHSWFATRSDEIHYVLMEVRQETDYVRHHAQKILAIFAAMRAFAEHLREDGHRVHYVAIDDDRNQQAIAANIDALIAAHDIARFEYQAPDEWRLDAQLAAYAAGLAIDSACVDSEHFYTGRDQLARFFDGQRQWRMERFCRQLRQRHQVLLDEAGKPLGGRWNFDQDNRRRWPGKPEATPDLRPEHDHHALWRKIEAVGVDSFGEPRADALRWPLDRAEALAQLDGFVRHALPHFGAYQDAMSSEQPRLFHSLLSFALNTKMLSPREVVDCAEEALHEKAVPLAAAEGFIRQILGWREYVRGIYWARMPKYAEQNFFDHDAPLPQWFWSADTKMRCLSAAIGQSLDDAYAHHIQRLMVIGNFALLAGLDPQAVHRWYLGVYIDAFEWVELPNTLGMSQFADGGLLASKPYVSSAAYIDRMSDYCSGCAYDRKARVGERACPFNALYWDFFERNRERLRRNPRLGMVYRQLGRMSDDARDALHQQAEATRQHLEEL